MEAIFTHENADFDALASLLAAAKLYPRAVAVLPRHLNRNLRDFLTLYGGELPFRKLEDLPLARLERLILVDSQALPSAGGIDGHTEVQIIDHHPPSPKLSEGWSYRGGDVGATVTILLEELIEKHLVLSPVEATLLLLGIYEDTGSLSYSTTTPQDLRAAAWLLESGANLKVVSDFLHQPLTEEQRLLYNQLIERSQTLSFAGHSVVIATALLGRQVEEIATLAHLMRDLYDPAALFLLVEMGEHLQLVARSTTDAIDVAQIARKLGGGGHSKAAAALIRGRDLWEAKEALLELLETYAKPVVTVGEIMSRGVHSLSSRTSVLQAEEIMRRYGHEGFPVVEDGRLVGLLTRREIDRAIQHRLGEDPVELYMHKGEISVSPEDSVEHLQRVMTEHALGQVPVVEEGKIIGIVTRTDLIKLWSEPQEPSLTGEVRERLREVLPPPLRDLLEEASRIASSLGFSLHLVGGFVRDLLLGIPNLDIDLVVEGDAIALAEELAREKEGRIHKHLRFGTAKWVPREPEEPFHLDFSTARTEFYEHPTALPQVERSSIRQDLYRRDFTINTLAICLDEGRFGQLLDFYGGKKDLERGIIRVLHNLSFIEDPTRILRAVRLEERLGFRIEERTEELMADALKLLDRVSGERIRQELYLVFQEEKRGQCLKRLEEMGVLAQISPGLLYDVWAEGKLRLLRGVERGVVSELPPAGDLNLQCLAILAFRMTPDEMEALIARLKLASAQAKHLRQMVELRALLPRLSAERLSSSGIYRLLRPFSREAIFITWVASDLEILRRRMEEYHFHLRGIEPLIDGDHLKDMGLDPGPIFREILEALRDARLDGEVTSLSEEEMLVREILADRGEAV